MFDIGVNLTSTQFAADRDKVVKRAREAGVTGMLITGTNALESQQAQRLAERQPDFCWSTAGVHPHHASEWSNETANTLRRLAERPQVVAIGECGLDFNRNLAAHEQQEYTFDAQLALAAELNMPVFLHCREAHDRFAAVLAAEAAGRGSALLYRHARRAGSLSGDGAVGGDYRLGLR